MRYSCSPSCREDDTVLRERLDALPPSATDLSFGNAVYKIRFEDRQSRPLFGHRYYFYLKDAVEDVPEYIVDWDNFVGWVSLIRCFMNPCPPVILADRAMLARIVPGVEVLLVVVFALFAPLKLLEIGRFSCLELEDSRVAYLGYSLAAEYSLHPIYKGEFHQIFAEHSDQEEFKELMVRMKVVDANGESSMDEDQWEAASEPFHFCIRRRTYCSRWVSDIYIGFAFEKR